MERTRIITNTSKRLMLVFVELEGWDYWLRPGESLEIRALIDSPDADFEIVDNDNGITVYPSLDMGSISVWQSDRIIDGGYQRPAGWS